MDEDSCRFVIGEVIAALVTVHDLGFVYGDLKPEVRNQENQVCV